MANNETPCGGVIDAAQGQQSVSLQRAGRLFRSFGLYVVASALGLVICSATMQSQELPSALAPILVGPYDGKEVAEDQIVWTWFMQSKASGGVEIFCDLAVAPILEGQSPEEALRVNPPVIFRENLTTSSWQTNAAVRNLEHNRRYTWRIVAKTADKNGNFRILSQSEIWTFVYRDPLAEQETDTAATVDDLYTTSLGDDPEQPTQKAIELHGSAQYLFVSENRKGNLSTAPPRFDRLQLQPRLSVFGTPLEMNILLTTEENAQSSDISRGAIGSGSVNKGLNFVVTQKVDREIERLEATLRDSTSIDSLRYFMNTDSATVAERLQTLYRLRDSDPLQNMETLRGLNLVSSEQSLIAQFPAFGFGQTIPSFGSMLLDNITLTGGMIEYNPGNVYTAAAIGKTQREVSMETFSNGEISDIALLQNVQFHRNLYSFRLGYGRRNKNYIALTGLYADDDDQSIVLQNILNTPRTEVRELLDTLGSVVGFDTVVVKNVVVSPVKNYGLGAVGHYTFDDINIALDGEFNLSYFEDKENYRFLKAIPLPEKLPNFLRKDSVLTDLNFLLRGSYANEDKSLHLGMGLRYVGGGYRSVGVAGMRTDILRGDIAGQWLTAEKALQFRLGYFFETAGFKDSVNTSDIGMLTASCDMRFPGYPAFSVDYTHHGQQLQTDKRSFDLINSTDNTIERLAISSSHSYRLFGLHSVSFASYQWQKGTSSASNVRSTPDSVGVFSSDGLTLHHRTSLFKELSIGMQAMYAGTENRPLRFVQTDSSVASSVTLEEARNIGADFSLIYLPFDVVETVYGMNVTYEVSTPRPAFLGGYFSARWSHVDLGSIEVRYDHREAVSEVQKQNFSVERTGRIVARFLW